MQPPQEAIDVRRKQTNCVIKGEKYPDHYHTVANPAKGEQPGERGPGTVKPTGNARCTYTASVAG